LVSNGVSFELRAKKESNEQIPAGIFRWKDENRLDGRKHLRKRKRMRHPTLF
jgi:hypothetical protein